MTKEHPLNVHTFDSTREAYDETQTNDQIKDGDILVIPSEGIIGFLNEAWPVAIVYPGWNDGENIDTGQFHRLNPSADITCIGKRDEDRKSWTVRAQDGTTREEEYVLPGHPGTDYSKSVQKCLDTAASDADITGNEHWSWGSATDDVMPEWDQ